MTSRISIAIVTNGKPYVVRTLIQMCAWADVLGELVIAADGHDAYNLALNYTDRVIRVNVTNGLGESAMPELAAACSHEWILRIDDDETGSASLLDWLLAGEWQNLNANSFAFPRMWLYPDVQHFIVNAPLFPDPQTRLLKREYAAKWSNHVHAGAPTGTGYEVPHALLHHKFLVRTYAERQETARVYDALSPGAGSGEHFGRFTLPELFYTSGVTVRAVGDGNTADMHTEGDMVVECSRKTGAATTLIGKDGWGHFADRQPRA